MAPQRPPSVPPYCASVLTHLLEAHDAARQLRCGTWQFACQLRTLILQGITDTALRWLVNKGYAQHRTESTTPEQPVRRFAPYRSLCFTGSSCFVLTRPGAELARRLPPPHFPPPRPPMPDKATTSAASRPHWDRDRRVLLIGSVLVKQFKVPALNQELILTAFEEEKW